MHIRPLLRTDIPTITHLCYRVFSKDELYTWIYPLEAPTRESDILRAQSLKFRTRIVAVGACTFVAVSEPGDLFFNGEEEIVGFAVWVRKGEDEEAGKWMVDSWSNKIERYLLSWESWYDTTFLTHSRIAARESLYRSSLPTNLYDSIPNRWTLSLIATAPEYRRRGIGTKLVEHGLEIAAKEEVPVTLEASPEGRFLYERVGFRIVRELFVCKELEGCGYAMVWEGERMKGRWLEEGEGGLARIRNREKS